MCILYTLYNFCNVKLCGNMACKRITCQHRNRASYNTEEVRSGTANRWHYLQPEHLLLTLILYTFGRQGCCVSKLAHKSGIVAPLTTNHNEIPGKHQATRESAGRSYPPPMRAATVGSNWVHFLFFPREGIVTHCYMEPSKSNRIGCRH